MINFVKLRDCLTTHPLNPHKKGILLVNAESYFKDIPNTASTTDVAKSLDCDDALAQEYRKLYLQIDWNSHSPENKTKMKMLINTVSKIMDWQWAPANLNRSRSSHSHASFFQQPQLRAYTPRVAQPQPYMTSDVFRFVLALGVVGILAIYYSLRFYNFYQKQNDFNHPRYGY